MQINERVPLYTGRSDLETWLGSRNVKDWIKLSELYVTQYYSRNIHSVCLSVVRTHTYMLCRRASQPMATPT